MIYVIYIIIIILIILIILFLYKLRNSKEQFKDIEKYIVCYPLGGFCDMLHVMDDCLNYAIKYNRILIIDTTKEWFKEDIYKYMTFTHKNIYNKLSIPINKNNSIYPPQFENIINKQFSMTKKDNIAYAISEDIDCQIEIDLSIQYTENIIFYGNCGGGIPYTLLNHFHFNMIITDVYTKRLNELPNKYISMHIRNTDYKSDVDSFLLTHHMILINNSCFIATDDIITRDKIKQKYGSNIYFFSNIPKLKGANIHYNHENIDHTQFIIDCIVDILLLASANNFYYSNKQSGYSKLALYLFENKQILNKILNI